AEVVAARAGLVVKALLGDDERDLDPALRDPGEGREGRAGLAFSGRADKRDRAAFGQAAEGVLSVFGQAEVVEGGPGRERLLPPDQVVEGRRTDDVGVEAGVLILAQIAL